MCDSFSHCFLTMLNYGIRAGSIGDFGNVKSYSDVLYWYHFIFSWIFYFIVILIVIITIHLDYKFFCFRFASTHEARYFQIKGDERTARIVIFRI